MSTNLQFACDVLVGENDGIEASGVEVHPLVPALRVIAEVLAETDKNLSAFALEELRSPTDVINGTEEAEPDGGMGIVDE